MADEPDLTGAERYVETADRPIAGGTWFVLPGDRVIYQRPNGEFVHTPVVAAHTLRTSPTWRRATDEDEGR